MTRRLWLMLSLVTMLASVMLRPPVVGSDQPGAVSHYQSEQLSERWVVRAFFEERQMVRELAAWREPWEVHADQGYLVLDVNQGEFERLEAAGFRLEIDVERTAELAAAGRGRASAPGQTGGIPGYPCYLTVEETLAAASAIASAHPQLATWTDIGDSWDKITPDGAPGYDLMVLRLTNAAVAGPKPKLFVMSAVHAREYATAELSLRFAHYLVDNYGRDADATWVLDYHEVHLLLQANPDGRKWAESGALWRKNTDSNYCADPAGWGIDLNRNFYFQWGCCGGSSTNACYETFRGPAPASEPETQAVTTYMRAEFADQRQADLAATAPLTATGVFIDLHSYSELVLWPWGFSETPAPNGAALQTLGRKLAYSNAYEPKQASLLYPTDGSTDDFAYGELGLAAYTFELGTSFFQDCATFEERILPDNLGALVYAAKVASQPYTLPAGPDVTDLTLSPAVVTPGQTVRLVTTVDDTRYNPVNGAEATQIIAAAEYTIDVPPWVSATLGSGGPLAAADGAFDDEVEPVGMDIDTSVLGLGRHTVFVRGRDSAGNWGAVSAAFLTVTNLTPRAYLPLLSQAVR